MSDRAAVRWTATRCGCMQTVLTPLRERGASPAADVGMNATVALADRTAPACIDAWLPWGKTSVVFPSPISLDETRELLRRPLLLLRLLFQKCPQWHVLQCTNWKSLLNNSWPFPFGCVLFFSFFFFLGREREVTFLFKNGNANNHRTRLQCAEYETVRIDWN